MATALVSLFQGLRAWGCSRRQKLYSLLSERRCLHFPFLSVVRAVGISFGKDWIRIYAYFQQQWTNMFARYLRIKGRRANGNVYLAVAGSHCCYCIGSKALFLFGKSGWIHCICFHFVGLILEHVLIIIKNKQNTLEIPIVSTVTCIHFV